MKTRVHLVFAAFTLIGAVLLPARPWEISTPRSSWTPQQCLSYCSRILCPGMDQTCGLYTNPQGQTVCDCH